MSWKNLASVAVCALLASPALALPSLQIESGGLDGNGDWVWNVSVTPEASFFVDNPPNGVGGSIAVELGLTASGGSNLVGTPTTTANIEEENPGNHIFGWEVEEDTDPGAGVNMQPVGLQVGTLAGDTNEIFAALGTTYFTSGGAKQILTITTEGPSTAGSLTSSIDLNALSIIAQNDPNSTDDTSSFAAGSASRTAQAADANLDGTVDGLDLSALATNFGTGNSWNEADFNGDGNVDGLDLSALATNFGASGGSNTPLNSVPSGAGAGSGAIPEPASIVLAGLALLAGLGLIRRK